MSFFLISAGLCGSVGGCSSAFDTIPTLAPTLPIPPPLLTVTLTAAPSATVAPSTEQPASPVRIASYTPPPTYTEQATQALLPTITPPPPPTRPPYTPTQAISETPAPVSASVANDTVTIRISAAQLNKGLTETFRPDSTLDRAPVARFEDGLIWVDLQVGGRPITLTLTASALATTKGSILDLRAVAVSTLGSTTTIQVKQGHTRVQTMLELLIYQASGLRKLNYSGVTITPDAILITLLME